MLRTILKDGTTSVPTRNATLGMVGVMRVIARNVKTNAQRAEVRHILFETRPGQIMLKKLESNLGLALVPVEMVK